jgi:regulator of replication initiation timing
MWRDLGISEQDWAATPPAVRTALLALEQQVRLMSIRFSAYEKQLASLREQVTEVDDLKAEIAELRERLGQNSSNSSKPPSSDPPSYADRVEWRVGDSAPLREVFTGVAEAGACASYFGQNLGGEYRVR